MTQSTRRRAPSSGPTIDNPICIQALHVTELKYFTISENALINVFQFLIQIPCGKRTQDRASRHSTTESPAGGIGVQVIYFFSSFHFYFSAFFCSFSIFYIFRQFWHKRYKSLRYKRRGKKKKPDKLHREPRKMGKWGKSDKVLDCLPRQGRRVAAVDGNIRRHAVF